LLKKLIELDSEANENLNEYSEEIGMKAFNDLLKEIREEKIGKIKNGNVNKSPVDFIDPSKTQN
jgi:hypothetical protein